jgi:hypothetical protein
MLFNNSIPLFMDATFDLETSSPPPLSFTSNKGKVYIVVNVSVITIVVKVSTSSNLRTS